MAKWTTKTPKWTTMAEQTFEWIHSCFLKYNVYFTCFLLFLCRCHCFEDFFILPEICGNIFTMASVMGKVNWREIVTLSVPVDHNIGLHAPYTESVTRKQLHLLQRLLWNILTSCTARSCTPTTPERNTLQPLAQWDPFQLLRVKTTASLHTKDKLHHYQSTLLRSFSSMSWICRSSSLSWWTSSKRLPRKTTTRFSANSSICNYSKRPSSSWRFANSK